MKKKVKQQKESKLLDVRKQKTDIYTLKGNTILMIMRFLFWGMLIFIFIKGVVQILQPSDEQQINATIQNFRNEFASFKGENEEIMAFAQNFAREYLTYTEKDESYQNRLQPYVCDKLYNMAGLVDFSNASAEATYVQAYRKEQYADNQYDVYVQAAVSYTSASLDQNGNTITTITTENSFLKIPVYVSNGAYIVEDTPVFVSDSLLLGNYSSKSYHAEEVTESESVDIKIALNNFFKAYYESDQSVIDYYLGSTAEKSTFWGLSGRYSFVSIDSLKCYKAENNRNYTCLVGLRIRDPHNGAVFYQEYNLTISYDGSRYYINDLNTKTTNLNL